MNVNLTFVLVALVSGLAFANVKAETTAGSSSGSVASTVNQIKFPDALSETTTRIKSDQSASAATVFVSPPSNDVCALPGTGISAQGASFGIALSNGGDPSATCETRADSIHLKVTGAPETVIKARQCQSPAMAQAFEDAGQPCHDRLRPKSAQTQPQGVVLSQDPLIRDRQLRSGK